MNKLCCRNYVEVQKRHLNLALFVSIITSRTERASRQRDALFLRLKFFIHSVILNRLSEGAPLWV